MKRTTCTYVDPAEARAATRDAREPKRCGRSYWAQTSPAAGVTKLTKTIEVEGKPKLIDVGYAAAVSSRPVTGLCYKHRKAAR